MQHGRKEVARGPNVRKVAVIGAGVMGQGIAAHMINAGLDCLLLDMAVPGNEADIIAKNAVKKIVDSNPKLIFSKNLGSRIRTGTIEADLPKIAECDLVIEAIVEKIDIKRTLFTSLMPHLGPNTVVASNTSGLSVKEMVAGYDRSFTERFLVMHFFNPVRYLHLLELVPCADTKPEYLAAMKRFGEERLGKGVVIGKDTTNFVANRIGVYGMMESIKAVTEGGYSIDEVDAVFGPKLGRPKSAVFRTADIVGLDTFVHVAQNCYEHLKSDECHATFATPKFLKDMVSRGWLGQKSGQGFYKKEGKAILTLDPKTMTYHEKAKVRFESIGEIASKTDLKEKLKFMAYSEDRAGKLFFDLAAKTCVYAAHRLGEIADTIYDIDHAMEWGFGWEMGPFKSWDAIGVKESCELMQKRGITPPAWVQDMLKSGRSSFYSVGSKGKKYVYCQKTKDQKEVPTDAREQRIEILKSEPNLVVDDRDAYTLIDGQNGVLIVEFHTKMNAIDPEILNGINDAIDRCERGDFEALVLANDGPNFSVGANILLLYMAASQGMWSEIEGIVKLFQHTSKRLKYCSVPTVSAPFQFTFGGGCELSMWCDRIQASAETYIGLVEVGVGLIPGGGGNIEMVARTLHNAPDTKTYVTEHLLMRALETVAMAKVATSAEEAKELLYLASHDGYSMNRRFLLHDALTVASSMARAGYRPPLKREFRLPGQGAYATFDMGLRSFLEGKLISEHDYKIAKKVAWVMTGGNTVSSEKVSEDALLDLEREAFLSLCGEPKTIERIAYMLENNRPLRN